MAGISFGGKMPLTGPAAGAVSAGAGHRSRALSLLQSRKERGRSAGDSLGTERQVQHQADPEIAVQEHGHLAVRRRCRLRGGREYQSTSAVVLSTSSVTKRPQRPKGARRPARCRAPR